jgi:quinolinate synthase
MFDLYSENNKIPHRPEIGPDSLSDEQVLSSIANLKEELKDELIILGHHYQSDEIVQFADHRGDSLKLAQIAAETTSRYTVFCGVHFMAETADMLTSDDHQVILPDLNAGCSMADMANTEQIEKAWSQLAEWTKEKIIPVTYINCSADLKAFVGRNDGIICTSSNAEKVLEWAFNQGKKVFFFPDQHLGRNTSFKMGIPLEKMCIYHPGQRYGGLDQKTVEQSKVLLWYGYCSVHQGFNKDQIDKIRQEDPEATIIVHPECSFEVVQASDLAGSTAYIIDQISSAAPGQRFYVGTEINLVNRLAAQYPQHFIASLSPYQCLCTTMYRVRPRWLLNSLLAIKHGAPINVISVSKETTDQGLLALDRMLNLS